MKKLYAGEIPVDDLVLSKKLSQKPEDYKTTAPHVELAKRLNGKYQAGERVEYFIRAGREPLNQRAIEREELSRYPLDFSYYAQKQLWNPIQRIMDLVVGRKVFQRRAITAPQQSGRMLKYLTVGDRRKKRKIDDSIPIFKQISASDIRSFFG
jgi:DNA polymerase elongation subunit (family B)